MRGSPDDGTFAGMNTIRQSAVRSPQSARLLASLAVAYALVACSSNSPAPAVSDSGAASAECVTSSDCHTVANTCNACSCVARPVDQPDPGCSGTTVACLVDPCLQKTASCTGGRCVIAD